MHLKRWITSLVIIPFLVLLISRGGTFWLAVVINAICILALWEYFCIVLDKDRSITGLSFQVLAFVSGSAVLWSAYFYAFDIVLGIITLNVVVSTVISLPKFKSDSSVLGIAYKQVVGIIYIPLFLSYLVLIRNGTDGILWIFLVLILVFLGDTGAYYVGSYFGRHKLCPAVSPNKTIEGSIGGIAASLGAGALFKHFFLPFSPWGLSLLLFFSISIFSQIGDLFESQLKRVHKIKDSGALLPGHGGVLDRIDALLFAAPVAYFFKEFLLTG